LRFLECGIEGGRLIELEPRRDERGHFARLWCEQELRAAGLDGDLSQVNTAYSPRAGTLRGLHFQREPHAEVKIVRCVRGAAFDVMVDLRPASPTFRRWFGAELSADGLQMLYVPKGCAHGFLTLTDECEVIYFASQPYAPAAATGLRYDDPAFGIRWPREVSIVSQADRHWPAFTW
jgi:dTDP-4-dehydrorhamnose 3,5-epimerase